MNTPLSQLSLSQQEVKCTNRIILKEESLQISVLVGTLQLCPYMNPLVLCPFLQQKYPQYFRLSNPNLQQEDRVDHFEEIFLW